MPHILPRQPDPGRRLCPPASSRMAGRLASLHLSSGVAGVATCRARCGRNACPQTRGRGVTASSLLRGCVGSVLGQFREPLARLRAEWATAVAAGGGAQCRGEVLEARQLMSGTGSLAFDFGATGVVFVDVDSMTETGRAVAVQKDGKVLAGGMAELADGSRYGVVVRFNVDGSRDLSFGQNGLLLMPASTTSPPVGEITALLVLDDGTILATGEARGFAAVRINPDGTLDQSFGNGGVALADI